MLANLFRKAGWKVRRQVPVGDMRADLLVDAGTQQYLVEWKHLSEGRRDRLLPVLAQLILESKTLAEQSSPAPIPVAVVSSNRIPISVAEEAKRFAERHAPEVGAGVMDAEGLRVFTGHGLERFDARPGRRSKISVASRPKLPSLFSDLNQWMLKILIGQSLPETLLAVPRGEFRNASQLAAAANVSTMSAFRFVQRLVEEGFLDDQQNDLRLVRIEELLDRWTSANRQAFHEIPVRWIIKRDPEQLQAALAASSGRWRCCLGLFAAADLLGFGLVRGVPPCVYIEKLEPDFLRGLGLTADEPTNSPDAFVRVPANKEAVFRAAVNVDGVPVSDAVQIWLDVSTHPARGREQADLIGKRALGPLLS